MDNGLTITEMRLIRSLLSVKTDDQLAMLVGKPVGLVTTYIGSYTVAPIRPTPKTNKQQAESNIRKKHHPLLQAELEKQTRSEKRKSEKEERMRQLQQEEQRRKEKQKLTQSEQARVAARKKERERSKLPTRKIDLTGTIAIRLNSKTTVWVKPGTDIEKLKQTLKIK